MQVDSDFRYPESEGVINIAMYILLSIVTCGVWALIWQYKQFEILNAWQGDDEHNFGMWLLLAIVTCGIYAIYYEYKLAKSINAIQEEHGLKGNSDLPMISVLLSLFGLSIVATAIQQNEINKFYD